MIASIHKRFLLLSVTTLLVVVVMAQSKRIVVDINGKGDYKSIQGAINSLPDSAATPRIIFIKKGIYKEKLYIEKTQYCF